MTPFSLGFATALGVAAGGLGANISSIIDALSENWERYMLNQKYDCPYCGEKFPLALMKEHINMMGHQEEIANQVAAAAEAAAAEAAAEAAAAEAAAEAAAAEAAAAEAAAEAAEAEAAAAEAAAVAAAAPVMPVEKLKMD